MPVPSPEEEARHEEANRWTLRGIGLLNARDPLALPEALRCFEAAIELRRELPLDLQPWFRWGLTAGWMNRGETLHRLGRHEEALASYDEALRHLVLVPANLDEAVGWRLALAHMNRGLVLRAFGGEKSCEALVAVRNAIHHLNGPRNARERATLGFALVNESRILLDLREPPLQEAQEAASRGLEFLRELEQTDESAAEASLHARHAFCFATAALLESPPVNPQEGDAWILSAADAVEEGLVLYQRWSPSLDDVLRPIAVELFRFGGRVYLAYQPHFLAEYVEDVMGKVGNSEAANDFRGAASDLLQIAAEVLRGRGPAQLGLKRMEDLLELLVRLERVAVGLRHPDRI